MSMAMAMAMAMKRAGLPVLLAGAVLLTACTTTPTVSERVPDAPPSVPRGPVGEFELAQFQRAKDLEQKGQWAEAAWAWEVLTVLRPQEPSYRDRLAAVQGQIDAGVAERLQKGQQAQAKGDLEAASQQYLLALSLQPDNTKAADALRAIEKERNKRSYLGTPSRITLRRGVEPKPLTPAQAKAAAAKEAREAKEAAKAAEKAEKAEKAAAAKVAAKNAPKDAAKDAAKDAPKDAPKDAVTTTAARNAAGVAAASSTAASGIATASAAGKGAKAEAATPADRNELEHIAMLSAQGEVDEAIHLLERRSAHDRRDPSARRLLADLYVRKAERVAGNDRAGAIGWLQKCLKIDEKHPRALALMRQWIDAAASPGAGGATVTAASTSAKPLR